MQNQGFLNHHYYHSGYMAVSGNLGLLCVGVVIMKALPFFEGLYKGPLGSSGALFSEDIPGLSALKRRPRLEISTELVLSEGGGNRGRLGGSEMHV